MFLCLNASPKILTHFSSLPFGLSLQLIVDDSKRMKGLVFMRLSWESGREWESVRERESIKSTWQSERNEWEGGINIEAEGERRDGRLFMRERERENCEPRLWQKLAWQSWWRTLRRILRNKKAEIIFLFVHRKHKNEKTFIVWEKN